MAISDLVFIDSTGYHYADYPTFLEFRKQQYRQIYGADIYLEPDSQDGQLVAIQAQADYDTAVLGASVYNSFSPATAQGVGLARNVKINGLKKGVPTNSTVDLVIVGVAGTPIIGGIATDALNNKWALPSPTLIPGGGSITVTATNQEKGAIPANPNTITTIFTTTRGWQSVNNPAAATPGAPVESDAALRIRQAKSTSLPARTVFDATLSGVGNLTGVTAFRGYENQSDTTDGNGLPSHSICVVVQGGSAPEIAQTILLYKTPGTDTFGNTTENVYDSHGMPYAISLQRPTVATIGAQIIVTPLQGWSTDFEALIAAAVAAYINAVPIGDIVQYTQLFVPAYLLGTAANGTYNIVSIEINKNGGSFAAANVVLDFDEVPFCDPLTDVAVIP